MCTNLHNVMHMSCHTYILRFCANSRLKSNTECVYTVYRMSENGVETMNVVREGGITDTDIAEVERLVDW